MRLMEEMSAEKLRGGYYTPASLVKACFERIAELVGPRPGVRILEPSAGDGAFARHMPRGMPWQRRKTQFKCIEILGTEAAKCSASLCDARIEGDVEVDSFFSWARRSDETFDVVVGNPPFVRYQFVPPDVRADADFVLDALGRGFDGVSNLWIPFVLVALSRLEVGGAFAVVLPAELFAIKSAGLVRQTLVDGFDRLTLDLYPRDSFPEILQDVIVVSGRKTTRATERQVTIVDHSGGNGRRWTHTIPASKISWTRFLLTNGEREAFEWFQSREYVEALGDVATLGVSIVTGANDYFTVGNNVLVEFDLHRWARPLMSKTVDCVGLIYTAADHEKTTASGRKAWLLDFGADRPDPRSIPKPARYIQLGEEQELHTRFKCRIREPWYRVPGIVAGRLMLTKRSHQHHRLLINEAGVFTTDTVYRGDMKPRFDRRMTDLVAGFHNSATLLSAEIEGRNYGGGVLELVPSEIRRVVVPLVGLGRRLRELDKVCRANGGQLDKNDSLIDATNRMLLEEKPELCDVLGVLEGARQRLRLWRFER